MFNDFSVNWQEALILLLVLVLIIFLYYFANRKSIAKEQEFQKLVKQRMQHPNQEVIISRKSTPQILQAYERLIILLERIDVQKLVNRVSPISNLKQDYAHFLIQNVEQEFDFNVSQQLYVTEEAWALIVTAKNAVVQKILQTALKTSIETAQDLQSQLSKSEDKGAITDIAKSRLRKEVSQLA